MLLPRITQETSIVPRTWVCPLGQMSSLVLSTCNCSWNGSAFQCRHSPKSESLLPTSVDTFVKAGKCDVVVYPTESEWYGVTYKEDKPWVVNAIQALIDAGEYPEHLWG